LATPTVPPAPALFPYPTPFRSVQVLAVAAQLIVDDGLRAFIALDAFTGKDLDIDHGADHARRHTQRCVFDVRRFFTKDGAQQFFFWRQLGFTLGRHFTDQHVVGAYFRTDVDN